MIIENLKKSKKNTYIVLFSDKNESTFYDDIIIKYGLIPKKELSEEEVKHIKKENQKLDSYYQAIIFITKKMRTKKELIKYLTKNNFETEEIEHTINKLEQEGYLNELDYCKAFVNDSFRFSNDGPLKISMKLKELGIKEENILTSFEICNLDWNDKLNRIMNKKVSAKHNDSTEKWKWKCVNYAYSLGYNKEEVIEITQTIEFGSNEKSIQKDCEKIKRKLERSYTGSDLNFRIKQKLYEKGYKKEDFDYLEDL